MRSRSGNVWPPTLSVTDGTWRRGSDLKFARPTSGSASIHAQLRRSIAEVIPSRECDDVGHAYGENDAVWVWHVEERDVTLPAAPSSSRPVRPTRCRVTPSAGARRRRHGVVHRDNTRRRLLARRSAKPGMASLAQTWSSSFRSGIRQGQRLVTIGLPALGRLAFRARLSSGPVRNNGYGLLLRCGHGPRARTGISH